ncbi:MAG: hypothetical protein AAGE52_32815 [Myxococcota bacterium]
MGGYREPSRPRRSNEVVCLPPHKARRYLLAGCLWFLMIWLMVWPVAWILQAVISNEGWWRVALAPFVWILAPALVTRIVRVETLIVGTHELRRIGFVRTRSLPWSAIRGHRQWHRRVRNGHRVRLFTIESDEGELLVAPDVVDDPKGLLSWALAKAAEGRQSEIDERVRKEGQPLRAIRWFVPHLVTALVASVVLGWVVAGPQIRREVDRKIQRADSLPYAERNALLEPIFQSSFYDERLRCRAGSKLTYSEISVRDDIGEDIYEVRLPRALARCEAMRHVPCATLPYHNRGCHSFSALIEASEHWKAGDAVSALAALEETTIQGPLRFAIEVPALRQVGRVEDAQRIAAECWERFGDSEFSVAQELVAACAP